MGDRAMRDKKRATDKFVTLNVQQISATLEQVGAGRAGGSGRGALRQPLPRHA